MMPSINKLVAAVSPEYANAPRVDDVLSKAKSYAAMHKAAGQHAGTGHETDPAADEHYDASSAGDEHKH